MISNKKENDFTENSVWKVILRMATPMILAQLVNVLYSIVDRIYIGRIPHVGTAALTGLGITMPIVTIIAAFAGLCGTGGAPLCSIARGEGNHKHAERIMGNTFSLLLFLAVFLSGVLLVFLRPILYAFGASDATYPYAAEYLKIYLLGTLFVMISLGMNHFINSQGFAKIGMLTVLLGAVLNIVLDPIFIFAFDMGIAGAAIATVIAQACSAVWALAFLLSDRAVLDFRLKNMILEFSLVQKILSLGATGFIKDITNGLILIVCNTQLQRFGGDIYVGAMAVISSVRQVIYLPVDGIASGCQPVLGYNYGAKAYNRVKQGIRFTTGIGVAYSLLVWIIIVIMPDIFARLFSKDEELIQVCATLMRIYYCGYCFMSLQITGQCCFVGLGKAKQAVFFSLLRKVVIVFPLIYFLPHIESLGVLGVIWAEPISNLVGGVLCYATMYFTVYKKLGTPRVV